MRKNLILGFEDEDISEEVQSIQKKVKKTAYLEQGAFTIY